MAAKTPRVTASMFYKYAACPHWVWFDAFGDKKKMAKTPKFAEMLIQNGVLHEEKMLQGLDYVAVTGKTAAARAKETLRLMREGAPRIYHGTLITEDMAGEPDILERRDDAPSDFGPYHYSAVDIKSAERLSDSHKYQLACYSDLLQEVQGKRPVEGCVLNGSGTRICFPLADFEDEFRDALAEIRASLDGEQPPPHLSSGCKQSPWFGQCKALAEKTGDIALLYNVKKKSVVALREAGVNTIRDAAAIDPSHFSGKNRYLKRDLLERIVLQAQALLTKKHSVRRRIVLPSPDLELFFDIEGDPLRQVEYLFGFRIRRGGEEQYKAFLAEKPEDEGRMWHDFLEWCVGLPREFAVYHYGSYEKARLTMLEGRYGGSPALEAFRERMIDLNEIVKDCIVFPLYFYGIKDIGKYIGFEREGKITGGGESVAFYEEWLAKGSRKKLEDILLYNDEDVIATRYLKDWLAHEAEDKHGEIEERP